jgi:hypothetical protein
MATLHVPELVELDDPHLELDPGRRPLDVRPCGTRIDKRLLVGCLQACLEAAARCSRCIDACDQEAARDGVARCRELAAAAAEACRMTARIAARLTELDRAVTRPALDACAAACRACAEACAAIGGRAHRACAAACRACADACERLRRID